MRAPAAAKRSENTHGMVISDGPVSKVKPCADHLFILPPNPGPLSHTVTRHPAAARRSATASPPRPPPMTAA